MNEGERDLVGCARLYFVARRSGQTSKQTVWSTVAG